MIPFWVVMFVVGMYILIRAASAFLFSAERFGYALGMPSYLVGVTIVSLGTTLPELTSSVLGVLRGYAEIPAGTAVGSIVTNILLVLGVVVIYAGQIDITKRLSRASIPLFIGATILLVLGLRDGALSVGEATLSVIAFVLYLLYAISLERQASFGKVVPNGEEHRFSSRMVWSLVIPPVFIYGGAELTIFALSELSMRLNIGTGILSATALAFGTSLPELVIGVSAVMRDKAEIAIGNVLGANIINATLVMGVAGLIGTPIISAEMISIGLPLLIASAVLYYVLVREDTISQWSGWMLLLFYAYYIGELTIF